MAETDHAHGNGYNIWSRSGFIGEKEVFFSYNEDDNNEGAYLEWVLRDGHSSPADPESAGAVAATARRDRIYESHIICVLPDPQAIGDDDEFKILTVSSVPEDIGWFAFGTIHAKLLPRGFLDRFLLHRIPVHLRVGFHWPSGLLSTLLVIVSTGAGKGSGRAQAFFDKVLAPTFAEVGIPSSRYSVVVTKSPNTIATITSKIIRPRAQWGHRQTVIVLSGDGGVHDIVNALLGTTPPVQIVVGNEEFGPVVEDSSLPSSQSPTMSAIYTPPTLGVLALGTANAMAHSYRLVTSSSAETLGLQTILLGKPCALPLFHASFSRDAEVVHFGSDETVPLSRRADLAPETRLSCYYPDIDCVIHGAVVLSYGYHAAIVAESDTPGYRDHGVDRFKMAASDLFHLEDKDRSPDFRAKISVLKSTMGADGLGVLSVPLGIGTRQGESDPCCRWLDLPDTEHALALTTLVSNLEYDYVISPKSIPPSTKPAASPLSARRAGDDNDMYFVYVPDLPGPEVERLTYLAYLGGKHVGDLKVRYEAIEGIKIKLLPRSSTPTPSCPSSSARPGRGAVPLYSGGSFGTLRSDGGIDFPTISQALADYHRDGTLDRSRASHFPRLGEVVADCDKKVEENDRRWRKICIDGTIVVLERGGKGWVEMRRGVHPSLIPLHRNDKFVAVNFLSPSPSR